MGSNVDGNVHDTTLPCINVSFAHTTAILLLYVIWSTVTEREVDSSVLIFSLCNEDVDKHCKEQF